MVSLYWIMAGKIFLLTLWLTFCDSLLFLENRFCLIYYLVIVCSNCKTLVENQSSNFNRSLSFLLLDQFGNFTIVDQSSTSQLRPIRLLQLVQCFNTIAISIDQHCDYHCMITTIFYWCKAAAAYFLLSLFHSLLLARLPFLG